jgi:hypothetical protein
MPFAYSTERQDKQWSVSGSCSRCLIQPATLPKPPTAIYNGMWPSCVGCVGCTWCCTKSMHSGVSVQRKGCKSKRNLSKEWNWVPESDRKPLVKHQDHPCPTHQPPHSSTYRGPTTETLILPSHAPCLLSNPRSYDHTNEWREVLHKIL